MPKNKTHKGTKKRIRLTATGKLIKSGPPSAGLAALAGLSAPAIYYLSAPDTWSPVVIGSNLTFTGGTLSASGGGGGGSFS